MIKFRAWDKENNTWLTWEQLKTEADFSWFADENLVFMQSTGLKDKNGVEIFEGDIVKIKQQNPIDKYIPNNSNNEIVYRDSAFCVKETWEISDIGWPIVAGLYYKVSEEFEVVGNIYENPELLEVAE